MFERAILPELLRRSGDASVIVSRVLRTWGESESGLNERLDDVIAELDELGKPTLAFLASGWEGLKVRLTAKAATPRGGRRWLDEWERRIRSELGELVFGLDDDTMESVVLDVMRRRGLTLGLAESVTGGLVSARLTDIARRQRRAAWLDRVVRERGQARLARRRRRAGRQRASGARDGRGRAPRARQRRGAGVDGRRRTNRAGRHARRARCASASSTPTARRRRRAAARAARPDAPVRGDQRRSTCCAAAQRTRSGVNACVSPAGALQIEDRSFQLGDTIARGSPTPSWSSSSRGEQCRGRYPTAR